MKRESIARISVDELMVRCLIGCLDRERREAQDLRVDFWLELDVEAAAEADDLRQTWSYADLSRDIAFILEAGRFHLLESAARMLLRWMLLAPGPAEGRPQARRAGIRLTKFGVLPGVARPSVELEGAPGPSAREDKAWGTVDVVDEGRTLGLYRLNIAPGCSIPEHHHARMREAELVLSPVQGWRDGEAPRPLAPGTIFHWSKLQRHGYANPGPGWASILCLDSPPFDPADEIEEEP